MRVTLSDGTVLTYRNASGMVLLDGDMAVSSSAQAAEYLRRVDAAGMSAQGLSRFAPGKANWPGNTVPYFWKAGTFTADQERVLQTAVARWNEQAGTAVKWVWDTSAANAVLFIRGDSGSCGWSSVGSVGGQQQLAINCFNSRTVIHEMGHAAGQWHEHQRCDRDKYVAIPTQYQGDSGNFGRNCNIYSYGPYDYDSVMNYGSPYVSALSQPGGPYAGDPRNLGRPADLSAGDISALRTTYLGSDSGTPAPPTPAPTPVREYTGTLSPLFFPTPPSGDGPKLQYPLRYALRPATRAADTRIPNV
ncbi:M12 family metallopeptidase [Deinococcus sp. SL84]|uniref:M12 family metallopeptidase n=1 Tax=Deinococcus sp. SL84 TaxID=2994663 RepID=UPI00227246A4|nr:M12 family metallopeptidase [Deinococcus sp. SL84]MCY1704161.1 M12 family metallopeptidase [Deinococcus sp. SL84]